MSIFLRDNTEAKRQMIAAIDTCAGRLATIDKNRSPNSKHDYAAAVADLDAVVESHAAQIGIRGDFTRHVYKLVLSRNGERAKKLVGVINDQDLRAWISIPILIILWPFYFIWRVIRLGFPS